MLDELAEQQCGVVSRAQALACGLTLDYTRAQLEAQRWQRVFRSVYATFSGPVPRDALLWAVVLRAGAGAVLSHQSAAEVAGLVVEAHTPIHVSVPVERRVRGVSGVVVHRSNRIGDATHPSRRPPQTRIEETVADLTQTAQTLEQATSWITRACGGRFTTPARIVRALAARNKLRWRDELGAVLDDIAAGAHSPLELRYLRDVERAHGLPRARRQHAVTGGGARFYDDVRYESFGVVVELDGRVAHPDYARWRDMRRDNASVASGLRVLRYGWGDVAQHPCEVARQVAAVLRAAGWPGAARPCRPGCGVITDSSGCYGTSKCP